MTKASSKRAIDNRANQLNPTHPAYYRSRGFAPDKAQSKAITQHARLVGPEQTPPRGHNQSGGEK